MADWEDEDYEPEICTNTGGDAWSGEDEDNDDVKDAWDASDSDSEQKKTSTTVVEKKKKPLKERIAEREAKKRAELEEKKRLEEEKNRAKTAEELAAEKERLRLQEEEEQLMLAQELVGVKIERKSGIDAMMPANATEFSEFATALKNKITQFESSPHYVKLLEDLFRDVCASLPSENMKKLGSVLNTMANEKLKLEKAKDGKKKKSKKATISQVRENDFDEGEFDEFEDFM